MFLLTKKINLLGVAALILGGTAAFTTQAEKPSENSVIYTRMADPNNPDGSNTWVLGSSSESCELSERICKASFPDNYDPNQHTYSENEDAAEGSVQLGFVPVE